ncbi:MAG: FG-GAP repeat protein [Uliginosibacterium sp.]|nr:FG-GAP repeat protein [Uliginosibacterium sp.]
MRVWEQSAYLKASNTDEGDGFGSSVAISDGVVVVGAPYEDTAVVGESGDQADNSIAERRRNIRFCQGGQYMESAGGGTRLTPGRTIGMGYPLRSLRTPLLLAHPTRIAPP